MRQLFIFFFLLLGLQGIVAQNTLDAVLVKYADSLVTYISTNELAEKENLVVLDSRKKVEFETSHLKDAIWIGYHKFKPKRVLEQLPDKSTPIVVYCSIGVRSNHIGKRLMDLGYTEVYNLYGGIFEWVNEARPIYDLEGKPTKNIHAYDREWGRFLEKGDKIYGKKRPKQP